MNIKECGFAVGDIVTASDWAHNTPKHKDLLIRGRIVRLTPDDPLHTLATIELIESKDARRSAIPGYRLSWYTERIRKVNDLRPCSAGFSEMFAI